MALKEKISILGQSKDGRVLTLKNTTGFESMGRDTGYGPDNGNVSDVLEYLLHFSRIESNVVEVIRITPDTIYPELEKVLQGLPFEVNSGMFEAPISDGAAYMFTDGVINLDSYSIWPGLTGLDIVKGTNFITGADFTDVVKGTAIQVNGVLYDIDFSKSDYTVANTVLYIIGLFQEDADSLDIAYQGNTKGLLQAVTDNQHAYITAKMSDQPSAQQNIFVDDLTLALHFKVAANLFVGYCKDWNKANDLVVAASKVLNKILLKWQ